MQAKYTKRRKTMKKQIYILALIVSCAVLTACEKKDADKKFSAGQETSEEENYGMSGETQNGKYVFFWETMELCDWEFEGDDDKVLASVIAYLAKQSDDVIFQFDDLMSELLYHLDTKKLADQCRKVSGYMSADGFLYSRCVALINGPGYYEKAKAGQRKDMWDMEFESLLYVPAYAWELKYGEMGEEYPHITPLSFETGSNEEGWK